MFHVLLFQAERPRRIVRIWFLKYEKRCELAVVGECDVSLNGTGGPTVVTAPLFSVQENRQALASLMQWLSTENVGLTVSSLAPMDAQLLITVSDCVQAN